jgi:hypothetical protein
MEEIEQMQKVYTEWSLTAEIADLERVVRESPYSNERTNARHLIEMLKEYIKVS